MSKDLNLSSTQYSTALSVFFVGYLLNEVSTLSAVLCTASSGRVNISSSRSLTVTLF